MLLKIIGSLIIIASSGLAGYYFGSLEGFHIADLSEMKRAMTILKSEIEFSKSTLTSAFHNISLRTKKPVSSIFSLLCEKLCSDPGPGIGAVWEECVMDCRKDAYFDDDDIAALVSFGRNLGYLDIELQNSNIRLLMDYIDARIAELAVNRDKNRKMFNSLGVLGGLMIVVLLV